MTNLIASAFKMGKSAICTNCQITSQNETSVRKADRFSSKFSQDVLIVELGHVDVVRDLSGTLRNRVPLHRQSNNDIHCGILRNPSSCGRYGILLDTQACQYPDKTQVE